MGKKRIRLEIPEAEVKDAPPIVPGMKLLVIHNYPGLEAGVAWGVVIREEWVDQQESAMAERMAQVEKRAAEVDARATNILNANRQLEQQITERDDKLRQLGSLRHESELTVADMKRRMTNILGRM